MLIYLTLFLKGVFIAKKTFSLVLKKGLVMNNLICMALAIYMEARGEGWIGQVSVAKVVQNRMQQEQATACQVISRPGQFTWYDKVKGGKHKAVLRKKDFLDALTVAQHVMTNREVKDPTKGAMYFHAKTEKPYWTKKLQLTAVIGNHKFYRERGG